MGDVEDEAFYKYYGQLTHQQNMLEDKERTGTYREAILANSKGIFFYNIPFNTHTHAQTSKTR